MKKLLFAGIIVFLFAGFISAQEDTEVIKKEETKMIIKILDEDGKITTKIIEGDDVIEGDGNVWITENGDSINIEVEVEVEDGVKKIKKRIVIPHLEDMDLEDLENNIEIFEFDDEFGEDGPRQFRVKKFKAPHMGQFDDHVFMFKGDGEQKGKLGVYIEDAEKGVKVKEVIENSAAYSVGILAGDVITTIDGKKMTNIEELQREVSSHKPGDMIDIKLKRNGKTKKFTARLHGGSDFSQFNLGPEFHEGMKEFKHHFHKGMEDCGKVLGEVEKDVKIEFKKQKEKMKELKEKHKEHKEHFKEKKMHKDIEKELEKSEENN